MWALIKRFFSTQAQLPSTQPKQQSFLPSCPTCTVLLEQLKEARLREARLNRQLEKKDDQVSMVLQSKFETVHIASENIPESSSGSVLPLESLTDVQAYDDAEFIKAAASMVKQ